MHETSAEVVGVDDSWVSTVPIWCNGMTSIDLTQFAMPDGRHSRYLSALGTGDRQMMRLLFLRTQRQWLFIRRASVAVYELDGRGREGLAFCLAHDNVHNNDSAEVP